MAVKNYGIHDKWTDLDKLNNVDIKSVDGVIESVKINGEEAGGGGGGSSDFSTAEVTLVNSGETNMAVVIPVLNEASLPFEPNASIRGALTLMANETLILNVPLYKGHCTISKGISGDRMQGVTVATSFTVTSGSATSTLEGVDITGNCTITINGSQPK